MPRFLLDTNIASFLFKKVSPAVDYRVSLVPKSDLAISVVTEAEIRFGLALLPAEARVHQMADSFLNQISTLTWDSRCAQAWATLAATQRRAGQTVDMADAMIAAHAIAYDLVLVSNDAVFALVDGLKLQDWTKGPQPA